MPAATALPLRRCADLFADFAKQSADLGAYGNGSRMKFIANHLVAIHNVATAEAMLLAQRAGLDPKMVVDMVGPGAGGSRMFQMRAPMMVEGVYEPATMKVSTWQKDMAIIAEFADDVGCATPLFTLTQPVYAEAMAMGLGDQDTASVFEVLKETIVTDPDDGGPGFRKGSIRATALVVAYHNASSSAKAEDPVRRDLSILSLPALGYWITRFRG